MAFTTGSVGGHSSSFVHHKVSCERFDLEPPNFVGTSIPTCFTVPSDMTSLTASGRKLSQKKPSKMPHPTASGGISQESFRHTYRGTISPTMTKLMSTTSLAASGQLQNATKYTQKCVKRVGPAKSRINRPEFNTESPNLKRTSEPT